MEKPFFKKVSPKGSWKALRFYREKGHGLYLVTDRRLCGDIVSAVGEALEAGARFVQLREKDLDGGELLRLARRLRAITRDYGALLIVNDRVDVALLAEADGVHLGKNGFSPVDAREALGEERLVGVSTHNVAEALEAQRGGADFITLGPVYPTPSKAHYGESVGIRTLKEVAEKVAIPVYAIGGIKRDKVEEVLKAGASGIAVISAVFASKDIKKSTRELLEGNFL